MAHTPPNLWRHNIATYAVPSIRRKWKPDHINKSELIPKIAFTSHYFYTSLSFLFPSQYHAPRLQFICLLDHPMSRNQLTELCSLIGQRTVTWESHRAVIGPGDLTLSTHYSLAYLYRSPGGSSDCMREITQSQSMIFLQQPMEFF